MNGITIPWVDNSHMNGKREMTDMREYMRNHSCMNTITNMANIEKRAIGCGSRFPMTSIF